MTLQREWCRQSPGSRVQVHKEGVVNYKIQTVTQVWLNQDRVKEGYAEKPYHLYHEPFCALELVGDHAVQLKTRGTGLKLLPLVYLSKLKRFKKFPDLPNHTLTVKQAARVDFDKC